MKTYFLQNTGSTMADARRFLDEGRAAPFAVRTDFQSRGRGRREGRKWVSEKGDSLMFTLAVPLKDTDIPLTLLPLSAGLALSMAVEELCGLKPRVKWPNDLLIEGRKFSGILCETWKKHLLVGMGVNLRQMTFPEAAGQRAGSLGQFTDDPPRPDVLLDKILSRWFSLESPQIVASLELRLWKKGETVEFIAGEADAGIPVRARILGLAADGALRLEIPESPDERCLYAGEISFHHPE